MWKGSNGGTAKMYQENLFYLLFTHPLRRRRQQTYLPWAFTPEGWTKAAPLASAHTSCDPDPKYLSGLLLVLFQPVNAFLCWEAQDWTLDTEWQSPKKEISHFSWSAGCTLYFNLIYFKLEFLMNTHRHWLLRKQLFFLNCKWNAYVKGLYI